MTPANLSPDLLPTLIRCNASQRGALNHRVNEGTLSPRQASPRMLRLLAEAEELRAAALRQNLYSKTKRERLVRPPWLLEAS